ncbi:type VII secretion protein EssB/YukC [Paenactinomyces guangxiensis]|uniref:Uncharacterized protein n=1 Tax=Paenactinomyces guangxiensis TaxID=1490290 RepID=A0A7W2A7B8_9BACL|nr:type VII secretion protein EssB/YukC [Paenactinomyces guangxiensis]MBA4492977.1 hypothetical protein [Paenactinomyces guangxiensis]MBH8590174.1 hypothetical protein [Paenactinomyces guangxiensis]
MKRKSFNHGTLVINQNKIRFKIPAKCMVVRTIQELEPIFYTEGTSFQSTAWFSEDEQFLILKYKVEPDFVSLESINRKKTDRVTKLNITENLAKLGEFFEQRNQLNTVFQPLNFYVNPDGLVKVLYCGVKNLLPAVGYEEEPIFEQVKRLIVFLFSDASFDRLRENGWDYAVQKVRNGDFWIVKQVLKAETYQDLYRMVRSEIEELIKLEDQKVKRSKGQGLLFRFTKEKKPLIKKSRLSKRELLITALFCSAIFLSFTAGYLYQQSGKPPVKSPAVSAKAPVPPKEKTSKPPALTRGYHYISLKEYKKAVHEFEQLDFHQLDRDDQKKVLFAYLYAGQGQKALELDPDFAEVVVDDYIAKKNIRGIKELKSDLPVVRFEQAVLRQDPETILQLQDKVKLDPRRSKIIVDAYIQTKQYKAANTFAQTSGDADLLHYALYKINEAISR